MLARIRKQLVKPPQATAQDLTGQHAIVTGCSLNSLGYSTARTLLRWGASVTITTRSNTAAIIQSLTAELGPDVATRLDGHALDLSDHDSTQAFAQWFKNQHKCLNILINNAGIHLDLMSQWKQPKLSPDGYEIQWRTNYLGTTQLSIQLLDMLLSSAERGEEARLVNVVSMLHSKGSNAEFFNPSRPYNSWEAYGQSKLGLVHFTTECQRRYGAQGLKAFCLHPGAVYTNVAGKGLEGNPLVEAVRNAMAPIERFFLLTPEEGAQTQLMCATAAEVKPGHYYREGKLAEPSADAKDSATAERLWQQTSELLSRWSTAA